MVVKLMLSALLGFISCLLLIVFFAKIKSKPKKTKSSDYKYGGMAIRNSEKNKK